MPKTCTHKFVHIRQEETETEDYGPSGKGYTINDIFFCEKCLTYKKIAVATRCPNYRGIYERKELL